MITLEYKSLKRKYLGDREVSHIVIHRTKLNLYTGISLLSNWREKWETTERSGETSGRS
jgi:hypothetical protein